MSTDEALEHLEAHLKALHPQERYELELIDLALGGWTYVRGSLVGEYDGDTLYWVLDENDHVIDDTSAALARLAEAEALPGKASEIAPADLAQAILALESAPLLTVDEHTVDALSQRFPKAEIHLPEWSVAEADQAELVFWARSEGRGLDLRRSVVGFPASGPPKLESQWA
jgi:hypothetical protein